MRYHYLINVMIFFSLQFREMYTNGAYETSSELEDISGDSANSSPNNRVAHLEESAARSNGAVVSKQSKTSKQTKTSQTKHILNTEDDHHTKRNHGDHRHNSRPHSRKSSRPHESNNRQI